MNPCKRMEDDCDVDATCGHVGPGIHDCTCNEGFEVIPCADSWCA